MGFAGRADDLERAPEVPSQAASIALGDLEAQFGEVEEIARVGNWTWEIAPDTVRWSAGMCRIYGVERRDAPVTVAAYLELVHPEDRALLLREVEQALDTLEPYDVSHRAVTPEGALRWVHCRGRVVVDADNAPARALGVCQDITERKLAEENLTRLALHDGLTGLPERSLFMDRLEHAIRRLDRRTSALALLFLDIDRFKAINDKYGHAAGDEALRVTTARLAAMLRPSDTIARFGGDEFAVLCEDVTERGAAELAARVVKALGDPLRLDGRLVPTSTSVGVACTSSPTTEADALLHDADAAMYEAKENGRAQFVMFDHARRVRGLARVRRAEEMRTAVTNEELRVYFQPEVELRTDTTVGVEALVRWQHPRLGLVGPDEFIAIAERSGDIVELGEWVLRDACRQVAGWTSDPERDPSNVAVNISASQLAEPSLVDTVQRSLDESGLAPARLCLEITESVLMDDVPGSIKMLAALKALGIRLAIDDFGTGYSSLSYLRRFPVDVVKIDRSFVIGIGEDPAADAIVAAVINLSHALGLLVVAEGVENEDQLVAVRALGCDRAQGFYWSPPVPAEELGHWKHAGRRVVPDVEPVGIYGLLAERTQALRQTTGRAVLLEASAKLGEVVAERRALRTVLDHVLGNAITYSPPGRPVVVSGASDRHWVRISVADFGVGMTGEESARCFEQFWQGDVAQTNFPRGTGMGLNIVRSLVEAMGGHIGVRSAKGKGTTFTVAFPRSARDQLRGPSPNGRQRLGEDSSIREFMRQIGVPNRRGA